MFSVELSYESITRIGTLSKQWEWVKNIMNTRIYSYCMIIQKLCIKTKCVIQLKHTLNTYTRKKLSLIINEKSLLFNKVERSSIINFSEVMEAGLSALRV